MPCLELAPQQAPPQLSSARPDLRGRGKDSLGLETQGHHLCFVTQAYDASPWASSATARWQRTCPARWTTEGHSATVSSMVTAGTAQLWMEK